MEERYRKMSRMGVRNIDGYNGRVREAIAHGKTAEVLSEENLLRSRRLAEAQGDFSHAPVCHAD